MGKLKGREIKRAQKLGYSAEKLKKHEKKERYLKPIIKRKMELAPDQGPQKVKFRKEKKKKKKKKKINLPTRSSQK
jgi:hypothetical protein